MSAWIPGRRLLLALVATLALGCVTTAPQGGVPRDLPIFQTWSGDYPVAHLNRFPEVQRGVRTGFRDAVDEVELFISCAADGIRDPRGRDARDRYMLEDAVGDSRK